MRVVSVCVCVCVCVCVNCYQAARFTTLSKAMMSSLCPQCSFLVRRYGRRVSAFLRDPPPDYMRAMGYDKDLWSFTRACEAWKRQLQRECVCVCVCVCTRGEATPK